ncbi:MAG: glycosyltransferase family 2 protein [Planctomycetes bacterium]|nr:glycosyltransferase family 2 protein [Planctomycetota bacterium]
MRKISIVVPIKDERENLVRLHEAVREAMRVQPDWELVVVDDGSTDGSYDLLQTLAANDKRVKVVRLRRNFGQAAAMQAGIDAASGDVIATMDGDLQNDPSDFPMLLAKLDEGYDVVLGERAKRQDSMIIRKVPSRIANWLIRKVTGLPFRDFGCTLRVMRREVASSMRIYGEMHRFIPVLAQQLGAKMTQVPVKHHPRTAGVSKYSMGRAGRVFLDLLTVKFLTSYLTRPMHFLGMIGLWIIALGFASLAGTTAMKIGWQIDMTGNPLLMLSVLLTLVGIQLLSTGLIGEVLARTYFESQDKRPYTVRETCNLSEVRESGRKAA